MAFFIIFPQQGSSAYSRFSRWHADKGNGKKDNTQVCVCVEHLKRCKTSNLQFSPEVLILVWFSTWFSVKVSNLNFSRGPRLHSSVRGQRSYWCLERICSLINCTYLHPFSEMGRGSTQEPPCRQLAIFISFLHCCRNLYVLWFFQDRLSCIRTS